MPKTNKGLSGMSLTGTRASFKTAACCCELGLALDLTDFAYPDDRGALRVSGHVFRVTW